MMEKNKWWKLSKGERKLNHIITVKKQFCNNICKGIEVGNTYEKTRNIFRKISKLRRKFQSHIGMLKDASEFKDEQRKMEVVY